MFKLSLALFIFLSFGCFAQSTISGRVINQAKAPVGDASVFLNNASVGNKTAADGKFILSNVKPGKYDLIISIVGFETYSQTILVSNQSIVIPDIEIAQKSIALKGVSIKPKSDPDRGWKYNLFKDEFLGRSAIARDCEIKNPEVLDFDYDKEKSILTASSYDFLVIENPVLGYRIKYLLKEFVLDDKDKDAKKIHFEGSVLFADMPGSPAQQKRWQIRRQVVYEGSLMHFLRATINNRMDEDGFRVLRFATYPNPERPVDSVISAKIKFYKKLGKDSSKYNDSLSYWVKKSKLPATLQKLFETPMNQREIISSTNQRGIYAFGCDGDALNISYSKGHSFHVNNNPVYLDGASNKETTLLIFAEAPALFDHNGTVINPNSILFRGQWSRGRVAGLLPVDYEEPDAKQMSADSTATEKVVTKLKNFSEQHITEKAYLHFDKPYYAAGDTIYFKAYVTAGERNQLSGLSGLLHVDLINAKNKIDQSIKLRLNGGISWGDFALPDTLPKGNYRVRAYTRWMRNAGDENYFDQIIPIGSGEKVLESATAHKASAMPDLQFFPEGGALVVGISSKVAFKAIGASGLGVAVNGVLIDNNGVEVGKLASAHLGMGYFYLKPEAGKTYKAKVTYENGLQNTVDIPQAGSKGLVLKINNDSLGMASVQLVSNESYFAENHGKAVDLLIYSGGIANTVSINLDSAVLNLTILKRRLKPGITKVTLFSSPGEPISERLLFIQKPDQVNLTLNTDKPVYKKREKVHLTINAVNRADSAVMGHFSVSVIDESKVVIDEKNENTISNYLLLTSELKGNIEQPNYYFTNIDDKTRTDLDLVMLTHGYRRFEWKKIINNTYPPVAWQPEKDLAITGIATNFLGKPLVKGTVSLIPPAGGPLLTQQTDDKGNFRFGGLDFTDTAKFVLQAVKAGGENTTKLVYTKDKETPQVVPAASAKDENANQIMAAYLENTERQWEQLNKSWNGKKKMLKEVQIRDVRRDVHYRSSNLAGPGHADQVMHVEEIEQISGQLSTSLNGRLRGIVFLNGIPYLRAGATVEPMLVILDGQRMYARPGERGYSIDEVSLPDVETVEVLKYTGNSAIYGMDSGHGVLIITTKLVTGKEKKDISSTGILPISAQGYYKARAFYTPKYYSPSASNSRKDLRSTIYWKPEVVTDKDGNASFDFFNADGVGSYRVIIEGMNEKGDLGWQVYRYKVE